MLDVIGWADPRQPAAGRIDLRRHLWAAPAGLDAAVTFAEEER